MAYNLVKKATRKVATQRTIALYTDQEEAIKAINKRLEQDGCFKLTISDIVREGVDSVITKLQAELHITDEEA